MFFFIISIFLTLAHKSPTNFVHTIFIKVCKEVHIGVDMANLKF